MIWKHCLRNALIPVVTLFGVFFALLVTGAIVTETVFAWPGVGRLTYEAVIFRDYPLLQAVILLKAIIVLGVNLVRRHPLRLPRSARAVRVMARAGDRQRLAIGVAAARGRTAATPRGRGALGAAAVDRRS